MLQPLRGQVRALGARRKDTPRRSSLLTYTYTATSGSLLITKRSLVTAVLWAGGGAGQGNGGRGGGGGECGMIPGIIVPPNQTISWAPGAGGVGGAGAGPDGEDTTVTINGVKYRVQGGRGTAALGVGGYLTNSLLPVRWAGGNGGAGGVGSAGGGGGGAGGSSANSGGGGGGGGGPSGYGDLPAGGAGGAGNSVASTAGSSPGGGGGSTTTSDGKNGGAGRVLLIITQIF